MVRQPRAVAWRLLDSENKHRFVCSSSDSVSTGIDLVEGEPEFCGFPKGVQCRENGVTVAY